MKFQKKQIYCLNKIIEKLNNENIQFPISIGLKVLQNYNIIRPFVSNIEKERFDIINSFNSEDEIEINKKLDILGDEIIEIDDNLKIIDIRELNFLKLTLNEISDLAPILGQN